MKYKIYIISFIFQLSIIILFETGILNHIIGYSDWDLYRRALLYGNNAPGFLQILNFFFIIFSSYALIVWYFLQIFVNSYTLYILYKYLPKKSSIKYFILYNPFFIIFYSGIFKEVILFNCIVWFAFNKNNFRKLITIFFYFLIRIHLAPFILFIITKFKFYSYIIIGLLFFYLINLYNIIDYTLIYSSITEIKTLGKGDLPINILNSSNIFNIFYNELILIFGFLFAYKLVIKLLYFITIIYLFYFYNKHKLYKAFIAFIIGLFPYSLIVTNSGTALRVINFLFITTISFHYINLRKKRV
jgi:hypothetical protein